MMSTGSIIFLAVPLTLRPEKCPEVHSLQHFLFYVMFSSGQQFDCPDSCQTMTAPLLKQTRLLGLPLTFPFFEGQSGMKTSSANRQTNQPSLSFLNLKSIHRWQIQLSRL